MTAPQLTKNGFYLSDILYSRRVVQILSKHAQIAVKKTNKQTTHWHSPFSGY